MQVAVLVLSIITMVVVLATAGFVVWNIVSTRHEQKQTDRLFSELNEAIEKSLAETTTFRLALAEHIRNLQVAVKARGPKNIIHLDLSGNACLVEGRAPVRIDFDPKTLRPNPDKIYQRLVTAFENEKHPSLDTLAYIIMDRSGLNEILSPKSRGEVKAALVRLLVNGDKDATLKFLRTLADSLAVAEMPEGAVATPATPLQ